MAVSEVRRLRLWQDRIETEVEIAGSGPPLVYLHGPWGLLPDRTFIAQLARANTVYAPRHPGTTRGDPDAVHALNDWLDLIVYHGELLTDLTQPLHFATTPLLWRGRRGSSPSSRGLTSFS